MKFNRKHKQTLEMFTFIRDDPFNGEVIIYIYVLDKFGEVRTFYRDMLIEIEDEDENEKWEDVPVGDILYNRKGNMLVKVWKEDNRYENVPGMALGILETHLIWTRVPCSSVRTVNGNIQRKKKG